ncbi:hypothetical protein IFM89_004805 [Coptis chinensis]|uniref:DUF4283 domain-containing protein n=1 Tax=Coptis chinensis TaxID=261450 RepID=A0A835M6Z5_9MAGN|nr:hypothetical protein IFM89_004805 [Coptis chinensis]
MGGAKWLGNLLCQCSLGGISNGASIRHVDDLGQPIGTIRKNGRGDFLQAHRTAGQNVWGHHGAITTFSWVEGKPILEVRSKGNVLNSSWWNEAVICSTKRGKPDWNWVRHNLEGVFGNVEFKTTEGGGALVFLQSAKEVDRLVKMPSLRFGDGEILFSRWNPEVGALTQDQLKEKELWVSFSGVLLHLKTKEIALDLSNICGQLTEMDESSLHCCKEKVRAKIKVEDVGAIPRIISLAERGYSFPIWVEVVMDKASLAEELNWPELPIVGPEGVYCTVRGETEHPIQHDPCSYSNSNPNGSHAEATSSLSRPPGFENILEGVIQDLNFEIPEQVGVATEMAEGVVQVHSSNSAIGVVNYGGEVLRSEYDLVSPESNPSRDLIYSTNAEETQIHTHEDSDSTRRLSPDEGPYNLVHRGRMRACSVPGRRQTPIQLGDYEGQLLAHKGKKRSGPFNCWEEATSS